MVVNSSVRDHQNAQVALTILPTRSDGTPSWSSTEVTTAPALVRSLGASTTFDCGDVLRRSDKRLRAMAMQLSSLHAASFSRASLNRR